MNVLKLWSIAIILAPGFYLNAQELSSRLDEKTNLYGFADADGNYVVKPSYKEVDFNFGPKAGLFKVVDKNDKVGFVNEKGEEVVPCKYDEAESFVNGYTVVKIKTGQFESQQGLLDSSGREIIAPKYGRLEYYPNDHVLVAGETQTSDVGLMDLSGNMIIPAQYEFWSKFITKGLWPVAKNNICGVVNLKNEVVVPFDFEMIESYSETSDLAPAKKGGKYGFIDRTGKTVIPFLYDDGFTSGPYLSVKKDGKYGMLNTAGKIILPIEYSSISSAEEKTAWVRMNENEDYFEVDLATKQKVKK